MDVLTPCFVIDANKLHDNFHGIQSAFTHAWDGNVAIGYSVKTNALPWLLDYAKGLGYAAEVVSDYELELALARGFAPADIIFNGPIKGKRAFIRVLSGGGIVNVDSKRELDWLDELDRSGSYRVGLRVNINLDDICSGESRTGADGSRFGFSESSGELQQAIERIEKLHSIKLAGLHLHVNSRSRSPEVYEAIAHYACHLKETYGLSLSYIDMGGGFFGGVPNLSAYTDYATAISGVLSSTFDPRHTTLIIEPGGSILATPIDFVSSVVDTKIVHDKRLVVTGASRVWLDPTMSKNAYRYELVTNNKTTSPTQVICGFTCMDTDRLMELYDESTLDVGDQIIYKMVGAYTFCFAPAFFIEPRPRYYLMQGDVFTLLKDRDSIEAIIGGA